MAPFSNLNTSRFKIPPLEDLSRNQDPDAGCWSLCRVVAELGFVSSIMAGIHIQRNGMIHQTSTVADIAKLAVFVAGVMTLGANVSSLYEDSIFAPTYNYLAPSPQPRRRRRRRQAQG